MAGPKPPAGNSQCDICSRKGIGWAASRWIKGFGGVRCQIDWVGNPLSAQASENMEN